MTVQAAVGFGSAFFIAPVLFALFEPAEAVSALLALGVAITLAMLYGERREHTADRAVVARIVGGSLPGLVAGALLLGALSKSALQVAVGVLIVAAGVAATRSVPAARPRTAGRGGDIACGAAAGLLTTSTGLNGPPLVMWLGRREPDPEPLRDNLAACLLALNLLGALWLVATGDGDDSVNGLAICALLLPLVAAGHQAGRVLFARMSADQYRWIVTVGVVVAGLGSIAAGLA